MLSFSLFRTRVKAASDLLRKVVPGMKVRTEKATVFEYAYEYILYLRRFASKGHEKVSHLCFSIHSFAHSDRLRPPSEPHATGPGRYNRIIV